MADLKEKFDTKDENSSGVLLHEYLGFTMTENNTQDHCISYAKLVQELAEQVPAIVLPCSLSSTRDLRRLSSRTLSHSQGARAQDKIRRPQGLIFERHQLRT
jgi:hypothetical protein